MKTAPHHHTVSPYLIVKDATAFIEFAKKIFNAEVIESHPREDGGIRHAEIKIGDSVIMVSDATTDYPAFPAMLYVYVEDTDQTYSQAIQAGATSVMAPYNADYGARMAGFNDAWGNSWWPATLK